MIKAENELNKPKYTGMLVLWAIMWGVVFTMMAISYIQKDYIYTTIYSIMTIILSFVLLKLMQKEEREYNTKQMQEDNKKINKHNKRISKQIEEKQNGKKRKN